MSREVEYAKPLTEEECKRIRLHAYSPDGVRIATFQCWVDLCRFVHTNRGTTWDSEMVEEPEDECLCMGRQGRKPTKEYEDGSTTRSR